MAIPTVTPPKTGIVVLNDTQTRIVTPSDPLIINETEVSFDTVQIEGGDITVNVATKVTIAKLDKKS